MRVTCTANRGKDLPQSLLGKGYFEESIFHVKVAKEYDVFAMALWESGLIILLSDDNDLPNWYPVELFSVTDSQVPCDWLCAFNMHNEGGLRAVWGYERLVRDETHHDALLERNPDALKSFREERIRRELTK